MNNIIDKFAILVKDNKDTEAINYIYNYIDAIYKTKQKDDIYKFSDLIHILIKKHQIMTLSER